MKNNGYLAVIKAKKKYNKTGEVPPKHNVLKRNFTTSCPFDKITTDITEIKNKGKKIYISSVKDLHTHVIEVTEIANHATSDVGMKMTEEIKDKSIPQGTIFHSNQGSIYNSLVFQKFLGYLTPIQYKEKELEKIKKEKVLQK